MSFASEVKKEILSIEDISSCCKKALLFGILQGSTFIEENETTKKIIIKVSILNAIKIIVPMLKELYHIDINKGLKTPTDSLGRRYYYLEITEKVDEIINDFTLNKTDIITYDFPLINNKCCKATFIRGIFAVKGSINDPRKQRYHLEINCRCNSIAETIKEIMEEKGIEAKIINKGQKYLVYIKKCESISDTLALIGANSGIFYFEDSRIYRDFANMANRLTNCDIANERKCAEACQKQLNIIAYLKKNGYFEKMPLRLQSIARMREEYPDSSLDELSEFSDNVFGKRLSKSGISHCMKDLINYYNSIIRKAH